MSSRRLDTKRLTVDVTLDEHGWLRRAQLDDDITHMNRMRALLQILIEDPDLQARVRDTVRLIEGQGLRESERVA
jgi:hypothetical protein